MNLQALEQRHREARADITIALARRADPRNYGVVSIDADGWVQSMVEKPSWGEVVGRHRQHRRVHREPVGAGVDPGRRAERLGPGHHPGPARPRRPGAGRGDGRVLGGRRHVRQLQPRPARRAGRPRAQRRRRVRGGPGRARRDRRGALAGCRRAARPCTSARSPRSRPTRSSGPTRSWARTRSSARAPSSTTRCCTPTSSSGNDADLRGSIVGRATEIRTGRARPRGLGHRRRLHDHGRRRDRHRRHDLPGQDDRRGHRRRRVGRVGVAGAAAGVQRQRRARHRQRRHDAGAHRPPRGRVRHDAAQGRDGHASAATTHARRARSTGRSPAPSPRRASTCATCAP